jgi:glycosyltransferase involved in cell wall biosynthesis
MSCADRLTPLSVTDEDAAVPGTLPGTVVLLATYNGVEFLADQLNSLRQQDDPDWVLVVRDDLSTDGTPALLDAFAATCLPGQVLRIAEGPVRLGALGNFLTLLKAAPAARRYAFCDQDDVWLPDKLTRAARLMDCETQERPVLYCARQRIVDDALHQRSLSPPLARPPSLRNAIVQNIATGCTIVMNEAARLAILATPAPTVTLHDWWSYLVTTAVGGRVLVDPEPVIMYRQHAANVVGAAPGIIGRARRAARRGPDHFMILFMAHTKALLLHPGITTDSRRLLLELLALPQAGRLARIVMLRRAGLYRQGMLEQLALYAWVTLWHPSEEDRAVHG